MSFNVEVNAKGLIEIWKFAQGELRSFHGTDRAVMVRSLIAKIQYELSSNNIRLNCVILNFEHHFNTNLHGVKFHDSFDFDGTKYGMWFFESGTVENMGKGSFANWAMFGRLEIAVNNFIKQDQLPHLLFYGPPGTGKTSTILACAKQLYKGSQLNSMVLELNASDDRGIGIVRGQILNFASTRTMFSGGFKLIILDEADAMTNDAQNALRRIIEKYTDNVRFCIICNYLSKIIPAVQSRCTRFRFAPLVEQQILPRLNHVIDEEKTTVSEDGKKALIALSGGDMRTVLNVLQSTWMAYGNVTEENVYTCVGHSQKNDIQNIVGWLLNLESFQETFEKIQELKTNKGLALEDILREPHLVVIRIELPPTVMNSLIIKLADIEVRLAAGCLEKPQLAALIAGFQLARNMVTL